MIPPKICHMRGFSTDERFSLCALCGKALHMGKGEVSLLQYYAACSDGFRPAVATVCKETGLSRRQAFDVRLMLEKHGIVKVSN